MSFSNTIRNFNLGAFRLRRIALPAVILLTSLSCIAYSDVPTDKQIADAAAYYKANGKRNLDGIPDPRLIEVLKDISLGEMTIPQLRQFKAAGILAQLDGIQCEGILIHLSELAKGRDAMAAEAAVLTIEVAPRIQRNMSADLQAAVRRKRTEVVRQAINHPGLPELLNQKRGFEVFLHTYFQREELGKDLSILATLAKQVEKFDGAGNVRSLLVYYEVACEPNSPLTIAEKNRIAACTKRNLETALKDQTLPARERDYLNRQMDQILGAAANGKLINHLAPHIDFLWAAGPAGGEAVKDFSAFNGKVVVIDYWATWCVPCIHGFPRMRELQAKYKDANIVFLGITSPQGRMTFPYAKGGEPKPVRDISVSQEIELLKGWTKAMEMTWTVACSKQDCFNPDFGVRGIPHMAIIDAKGIVRYNSLEIEDPTLETKIQALLKETGK